MNLSCSQFFSNHSETETENKLEILEETTNHAIEINPEEFDPHTKPEAKTIEASDISAHPHLEPYKGLILLSNLKTHIVFLGIPSTPSQDRWNQRIAVIFIKNDHLWEKVEDIELISVIFAVYGALFLVIPHHMNRICCFCCVKKKSRRGTSLSKRYVSQAQS